MTTWNAIILAAGKGARMKSKRPKVLHEICGQPMVSHVIAAAGAAGVERVVVVVGSGAQAVRAALGTRLTYVEQLEQRGTGHAVLQALSALHSHAGAVLVLNGDLPLVRSETIRRLMAHHEASGAGMTFLTCALSDAEGLGRITRDADARATGIVEWAHASETQRHEAEINVGAYCFDAAWLRTGLPKLAPSASGEIYLTDMVALTLNSGRRLETLALHDPSEAIGVDTRLRLSQAEAAMRQRIREHWMREGVTLIDPPSIQIDAAAHIGQDTIIHPQTAIRGATCIGQDCEIGPWSIISASSIGDGCKVLSSMVEEATLERHVDVGPFSHLRPGTYLEEGVHIGNYVEIKKSRLARDAKSGHFSYIGDASIGRNVNIGAGTITCNFDGINKLPTIIEDDVFVGCDTMLVAPVRLGAGSKTGAGAVVVNDVPPNTTVVGVPAKPLPNRDGGKTSAGKPEAGTGGLPSERKG